MDSASAIVVKDEDVWFDDGNIVIITNGTTAFRVYKGLLAHVSPVFSDLFSIPQETGTKDTMDGCPVVRVTDHVDSFRILLRLVLKPDFA